MYFESHHLLMAFFFGFNWTFAKLKIWTPNE
jgi:hypothetical protein